jgi:hypothetical protein
VNSTRGGSGGDAAKRGRADSADRLTKESEALIIETQDEPNQERDETQMEQDFVHKSEPSNSDNVGQIGSQSAYNFGDLIDMSNSG